MAHRYVVDGGCGGYDVGVLVVDDCLYFSEDRGAVVQGPSQGQSLQKLLAFLG